MEIPQEQVEFCQKIAAMAKEHGCHVLSLTFTVSSFFQPEGHAPWNEQIQMTWAGERHNENNRLHISTTLKKYINIYDKN